MGRVFSSEKLHLEEVRRDLGLLGVRFDYLGVVALALDLLALVFFFGGCAVIVALLVGLFSFDSETNFDE